MAHKRSRCDSDAGLTPLPKRARAEKTCDSGVFEATSSAPGSPSGLWEYQLDSGDEGPAQPGEEDDLVPERLPLLLPALLRAQGPSSASGPAAAATAAAASTARGNPILSPMDLDASEAPYSPTEGHVDEASAPPLPVAASSPMSVMLDSPKRRGRRRVPKSTRGPRKDPRVDTPERKRVRTAQREEEKRRKAKEAAEKARLVEEARLVQVEKARVAKDLAETLEAQEVWKSITDKGEKGHKFDSMRQFLDALFRPGGDLTVAASVGRFFAAHGAETATKMFAKAPKQRKVFMDDALGSGKVFEKEGLAIQKLLTRNSETSVTELLNSFSMETWSTKLQAVAPTLWGALGDAATTNESTRRESLGESRRQKDKDLVLTTICAMLAILRSQKANNYQLVIGLFLLASGSSKREIEVLAHAGMSVSYSTILTHVKTLSAEGTLKFQAVIKKCMCSIVWDNLNIAFRIESQRLGSTNHFDNGTTATVIPLFNPLTGKTSTPHGTLPFSMKPPRTTTLPIFEWDVNHVLPSPTNAEELSRCCIWQLKRIALEHIEGLGHLKKDFEDCPQVDPIALHQTEQFPLPAMHEDESSIDGTIRVYETILRNLGFTDEMLEKHGLLFTDGDLLTDSLVDKIESARRNSTEPIAGMKACIRRFGLFHAEMAGCRMTVNEHWGKPNSLWPGSLWWEHTNLLKRKPMTAGWQAKKATPWKPSHELLQISLAAHVKDAFRICCGSPDLEAWASCASTEEFDRVAKGVHRELFSTEAYDNLRELGDIGKRDVTLENVILYNRDALFYIEFVAAIKKGDIGRVVNVLRFWMVMMRAPKTMPKYADAIFETLGRIDKFDPKLKMFFLHNWLVNLTGHENGFKPIDLLQEHQNFWAKIIYTAKGSNRSWKWLAMITVCIFTLRDTMRTVQKSFKIPAYGLKHKVPNMTEEVRRVSEALAADKIQQFILNRPGNEQITPVRDLFEEGSKYPNTRTAFQKFRKDTRKAVNLGVIEGEVVEEAGSDEEDEDEEGQEEEYEATPEDLELDDDEPYNMAEQLLAAAESLVDDFGEE